MKNIVDTALKLVFLIAMAILPCILLINLIYENWYLKNTVPEIALVISSEVIEVHVEHLSGSAGFTTNHKDFEPRIFLSIKNFDKSLSFCEIHSWSALNGVIPIAGEGLYAWRLPNRKDECTLTNGINKVSLILLILFIFTDFVSIILVIKKFFQTT